MRVIYSVRSHKGNVRENNEDNFFADGIILPSAFANRPFSADGGAFSPTVLAVCDGMGGEESGEAASMTAVKNLGKLYELVKLQNAGDFDAAVKNAVDSADCEIKANCKRSGTTLALAVISGKGAFCYNIGDSRIYCLKNGVFSQVTTDHTQGAEIASTGVISPEKARLGKGGNKLTRCIGIGNFTAADSYPKIRGKFRLVICSDGLSDMVSDSEINAVMARSETASDAAECLLKAALAHGGKDNVTVIAADIQNSRFAPKR